MDLTNPASSPASEPVTKQPVMDVVPPRPADVPKDPPTDEAPPVAGTHHAKPQKQAVSKPPKRLRSGVALAVTATVVIVIGLSALFVYAYLRTQNISSY